MQIAFLSPVITSSLVVGVFASLCATFIAWLITQAYNGWKTHQISKSIKDSFAEGSGSGFNIREKVAIIELLNSTKWIIAVRIIKAKVVSSSQDEPRWTSFRYGGRHSPARVDWIELPPQRGDFWEISVSSDPDFLEVEVIYDFQTLFGARKIERVRLSQDRITTLIRSKKRVHEKNQNSQAIGITTSSQRD